MEMRVPLFSRVSARTVSLPIFRLARVGVAAYRVRVLPRLERMKLVRAVRASKLYTVYSWFKVD